MHESLCFHRQPWLQCILPDLCFFINRHMSLFSMLSKHNIERIPKCSWFFDFLFCSIKTICNSNVIIFEFGIFLCSTYKFNIWFLGPKHPVILNFGFFFVVTMYVCRANNELLWVHVFFVTKLAIYCWSGSLYHQPLPLNHAFFCTACIKIYKVTHAALMTDASCVCFFYVCMILWSTLE